MLCEVVRAYVMLCGCAEICFGNGRIIIHMMKCSGD